MDDFYILQRDDCDLYFGGFSCIDSRRKSFRRGDLSTVWVTEPWNASPVPKNYIKDISDTINQIENSQDYEFGVIPIHIKEFEDYDNLITDMETYRIHHQEKTIEEELERLKKDDS